MKLLLDECVTRYLRRDLSGHDVFTVDDAGFKGLKNGRLLSAASGNFDVLITVDRKLPREQKIVAHNIAVVVLIARTNRYEHLRPLLPLVLEQLKSISPGEVIEVRK